jgi:hypothetical protein
VAIETEIKSKAIPVTGHEGPQSYETSRLPHFVDSRLTDGGDVIRLTPGRPLLPRKIPGVGTRNRQCKLIFDIRHALYGPISVVRD